MRGGFSLPLCTRRSALASSIRARTPRRAAVPAHKTVRSARSMSSSQRHNLDALLQQALVGADGSAASHVAVFESVANTAGLEMFQHHAQYDLPSRQHFTSLSPWQKPATPSVFSPGATRQRASERPGVSTRRVLVPALCVRARAAPQPLGTPRPPRHVSSLITHSNLSSGQSAAATPLSLAPRERADDCAPALPFYPRARALARS